MTPDIAAALRAPFPPEKVGKLPRVTCGKCRDSRERSCESHGKSKCSDCGNWITSAHIHLDFVGHADATDRFLEVDPEWFWEPFALDAQGLPAFDGNGGMWIRLTIAGTTRIGYGDADGKKGANAVKEAIGDALRNAGLRFGVALDLWRKEGVVEHSTARQQAHERPEPAGWDPETQVLIDAFMDEIRLAKSAEDIATVGKSVKAAKDKGELPKAAYDRLAQAAAIRKAELNGAPK
jgi:hypothetical protein